MKNNFMVILTIVILIILVGGYFFWPKTKMSSSPVNSPAPTPSPEMSYPKVETFEVPILMYHYIRNAENESQLGQNLSVSPKNFASQVKWLKDNGYETLKVADLADPERKALSKIAFEKKRPIVLTFDDGYLDAYTEALPILQKYQATATFYVIQNYIGRPEYMDQAQIAKLEKAGMEIGSHTLSHPDLTKVSAEEAQRQIFDSKGSALTFVYPSGKYNQTTVKLVQEAGYKAGLTTHFGIADQNSSILELPRVRVENGSGETLGLKIEAAYEQSK